MSSDASKIILRSQDEGYYLMEDADSLWSNSPVTITPPNMVAQNVGEFETTLGMSADGNKVVALGDVDAWLSSDVGVTWAKAESLTSLSIEPRSVAMSPDGSKILICGKKGSGPGLAVSHDTGSTWTELASPGSYFQPLDCSMSADGQTIAVIANGFEVMVSSDGGSSFSASTSGSRNDNIWKKVLVSKDGSKILVSNTPRILGANGNHAAETAGYISLDSGATWTRPTGVSPWIDMAMSDDGSTIYVLADMECSGGGYECLGGGFKYFFCSPLLGEDFQFDELIFEMGWFNHQLGVTSLPPSFGVALMVAALGKRSRCLEVIEPGGLTSRLHPMAPLLWRSRRAH